jgi:ABC-type nitrate/sulfonate/bicarbonate transport system substrate-binding protein
MRWRVESAAALVLGLAFTWALPSGSLAAGTPATRIIVAQGFVAPFAIGVWIAGSQGIFARNGLEANIVIVNSTQAMQALPGGSVQVMLGSPGQGLAAASTGTIDTTVIDPAQWLAADRAGLSLIADLTTNKIPWDHDVVQMTRGYIQAHRNVAMAFVRSLVEANAFILNPGNKAAVVDSLVKNLKMDWSQTGDLELNYQIITKFYTVRKPYPSLDAARLLIENLKSDFPDLTKAQPDRYVDGSIVKTLDDSGEIDKLYRYPSTSPAGEEGFEPSRGVTPADW